MAKAGPEIKSKPEEKNLIAIINLVGAWFALASCARACSQKEISALDESNDRIQRIEMSARSVIRASGDPDHTEHAV